MILKPSDISPNGEVKDAREDIEIHWNNNGDRQYYYEVNIYDNQTENLVYSSGKISSYSNYHIIPSGTLISGNEYKYKVTVYNQLNESATSDWVVFTCNERPVGYIINVGVVSWANKVGVIETSNGGLEKTNTTNTWDSGASSATQIDEGECFLRFVAGQGSLICGLSHGDTDQSSTDIDFGIYLKDTGHFTIIEGGVEQTSDTSYLEGDIFKITVDADGLVEYYKNNELIYQSISTPTYPLVVDTSFYSQGAYVENIILDTPKILNSSYLFQGAYRQNQDISIKSFRFVLYDEQDRVVATSGEIYSDTIEYEFDGLINKNVYQVELRVTSQDNLQYTTDRINFEVQFETPYTSMAINLTNNYDKASVLVEWKAIRILGQASGTVTFSNGEKVDLTNGEITFSDNLEFKNDFNLKLWIDWVDLTGEIEIAKIKHSMGEVIIYYNEGNFYMKNTLNHIDFWFKSNNISPIVGDTVFFSLKYENNLAELYAEVVI